jgi:hypothetical protein
MALVESSTHDQEVQELKDKIASKEKQVKKMEQEKESMAA